MSIFYCELSASKDLDMTRKKLPLRMATKCLWDWQVQLATKMPMGKNGYQKKNKKNSLEELKPWLLFLCFLRKGYELAAKCSQHQQKLQCCRKDLRCVKLLQMQNEVVSDLIAQGAVCPEISHEAMPSSSQTGHQDTRFCLGSQAWGRGGWEGYVFFFQK